MRFFDLLDIRHLMLTISLGVVGAIVIYLGFQSYFFSHRKEEEGEEDFPEGIRIQNHTIPPLIMFVIIGFFIWAVFYVILIGLFGNPF